MARTVLDYFVRNRNKLRQIVLFPNLSLNLLGFVVRYVLYQARPAHNSYEFREQKCQI